MNVSAEALGAGLSGLGSFGGENEPPPSAPTQANPGLRRPSLVAKGTGSPGPGCYIPSLPNSLHVLLPLSLVTRGRQLLKSFLGWELPLSQLGASLLRKPPPHFRPRQHWVSGHPGESEWPLGSLSCSQFPFSWYLKLCREDGHRLAIYLRVSRKTAQGDLPSPWSPPRGRDGARPQPIPDFRPVKIRAELGRMSCPLWSHLL